MLISKTVRVAQQLLAGRGGEGEDRRMGEILCAQMAGKAL